MKVHAYMRCPSDKGGTKDWALLSDGRQLIAAFGTTGRALQTRTVSIKGSLQSEIADRIAGQEKDGYYDIPNPGDEWMWNPAKREVVSGAKAVADAVAAAGAAVGELLLTARGNAGDWQQEAEKLAAELRLDITVEKERTILHPAHATAGLQIAPVPNRQDLIVASVPTGAAVEVVAAMLALSGRLRLVLTGNGDTEIDPKRVKPDAEWLNGYVWRDVLSALEKVKLYRPNPFAGSARALSVNLAC